jgi:hypothetical protein
MPAIRTTNLAEKVEAGAHQSGSPRAQHGWHNAAAALRHDAKEVGFGALIAAVVVLVPLLDALRYVGEVVLRNDD